MFLQLGLDHINNNDCLALFSLSSGLQILCEHRIFSANTHWPEDMVVVGLGIRDNVDLNSGQAPRDQFLRKKDAKRLRLGR